jgi:hypothetical protein
MRVHVVRIPVNLGGERPAHFGAADRRRSRDQIDLEIEHV